MMKKVYVAPDIIMVGILDADELCKGGLGGWSANNESNGTSDSTGNTDKGTDPPFGVAGSKEANAWSTWDD